MITTNNPIIEKNNQQYFVSNQLTDNYLSQMVDFAHTDQQVIDNTSDKKRFFSLETAQEWLKKAQKYFFALSPIENKKELAGIIWFEKLELPKTLKTKYPNSDWTFGIRIYEKYRGNGLAIPFMKVSFETFFKKFKNTPIWLSTNVTNQTATKLYQKFGFKKIGEENNKAYFLYELDHC